MFTYSLRRV
uniref:Uncharacterized protein n=1 Tax=Anguilla anguilla TaxID=7936 RepID=A0A0E9VCY1_ANGAN